MMITAPYNFVPLSRFVYFPDWADQVSHDVPFSDGVSGTIICELKSITPVYVRNGGNWEREDILKSKDAQSFFKVGEDYIIPGTSIKGMLRNVLEIISFGKMGKKRVDNQPYSIRDLTYKPYTKAMTDDSKPNLFKSKVHAGWLKQDKRGAWHLTPCDYVRVEQQDLIKLHSGNPNFQLRQNATAKYLSWHDKSLTVYFCHNDYLHNKGKFNLSYKKATSVTFNEDSTKAKGTIVFTGQPGPNKHMEFIFFKPDSASIEIGDNLQDEFLFIHRDSLKDSNNWEDWQSKLDDGENIPVFYVGETTAPKSIGLAQMYRLPYTHSILKTIEHTDKDHMAEYPDLADTIFGFIDEKGEDSLKGRVSISYALADSKTVHELSLVNKVFASPKPTYYPSYIKQTTPVRRDYATMMDANAQIRGWKRYPARNINNLNNVTDTGASDDMVTKFIPLKEGTNFCFSVRFHNLRPVEIGALIWSLKWGGNTELCHSLGMAKPFGYGQINITIDDKRSKFYSTTRQPLHKTANDYMNDYMKVFVTHMRTIEYMPGKTFDDWETSEQIEQLKAMANPNLALNGITQKDKLKYMRLTVKPNINDFRDAKNANPKEVLEPHLLYTGQTDEKRFTAPQLGSKLRNLFVKDESVSQAQVINAARSITQCFNEIKNLNDKNKIIDFFKTLKEADIDEFSALDLTQVNNVLNIGTVDEFIALEMDDKIKAAIARNMLRHIKPTKKWDQNKKDKYEKLKEIAALKA